MNLYFDVDLEQLIQSPGARSAIQSIGFKSQNTPRMNVYFVSGGDIQDEGESPVLKFGLFTKDPTPVTLVLDAAFTRGIDAKGGVYYSSIPVFDTTAMRTAMAGRTTLDAVGEIRAQLASGEIVHSLDIPFLIYRTLLDEGGTAAPVGTESYPDVSTLLVAGMKNQPSGVAALDSGGFLLLSAMPAGVELVATRDVAGGHAGLDVDALLLAAVIPIDGSTIISDGTKLHAVGPAQGVVAVTTEAFTVPAVGATVPISLPTGSLTVGAYYILSGGAGLYQFTSATDSTHGVLTNVGSALNAAAGTVIPYGANLTWSGPPGPRGLDGVDGINGTNGAPGAASTVAGPPGTNGTNGVSFIWLGAWANGTAYVPNNVVSRNGSTYINTLANTGSDPATDAGAHWALFTEKGMDGTGIGDMLVSVYAPTGVSGKVDHAILADQASAAASGSALETSIATAITTAESVAEAAAATASAAAIAAIPLVTPTTPGLSPPIDNSTITIVSGKLTAAGGGGAGASVFAQVWRAANITYADMGTLAFDAVITDVSGFWNSGAPTKLTVPTGLGGLYIATFNYGLAFGSSGGATGICIAKNGWNGNGPSKITFSAAIGGMAAAGNVMDTLTGLIQLAAGDYINCVGFTNNVPGGGGTAPVTWVSISAATGGTGNLNGPMPMLTLAKIG